MSANCDKITEVDVEECSQMLDQAAWDAKQRQRETESVATNKSKKSIQLR